MNNAIRYGLGLAAVGLGVNALVGDGAHRSRVERKFPGTAEKAAEKKRLDEQPKMTVSYFDIKATPGEKLRLALALSVGKDNFEDDRVSRADWPARKASCKYGQMPILTIDGESHYQSGAALRYIGATAGDGSLYPTDDVKARFEIDKMLGLSEDLDKAWRPALYAGMNPQYLGHHSTDVARTKRMREQFLREQLPKYMGYIKEQLATTGGFIAGDKPTIADCHLYPQLDYFRRGVADFVPADTLDQYPEVLAYLKRVEEVPAIAEWQNKDA